MFTRVDKAIAAFLGSSLYFLGTYFGLNLGLDEKTVILVSGGLAAVLTYLMPNRS